MFLCESIFAIENIVYICKRGIKECSQKPNLNLNLMKRMLFSCLLILCVALPALAQNRVGFAYDAVGNRVKKELNVNSPQKSAKKPKTSSLLDNVDQRAVQIITNNSTRNIKIVFQDSKSNDKRNISVCTSAGAKIYDYAVETEESIINLAEHPAGIYMLTITINDTQSTWKVTKR